MINDNNPNIYVIGEFSDIFNDSNSQTSPLYNTFLSSFFILHQILAGKDTIFLLKDKVKNTLTQNISGAIVRVHSGAQVSVENDASFKNGVDKAYKEHITEFQKRNVPVAVYAYVAGKNVEEMEKAAEAFYNAASPYNPSYYWLDVEEKTMSDMNQGVEAFRAKLASLGAKNIGIYVGVYFMEEHSISVDNYSAIWIPSYGTNSGYYENAPKTDLSYDLHQYTSHGNLGGFEHHLDLNLISSSKNKEETFRKLFLNP